MNNYELALIFDPANKDWEKVLTRIKGWIDGAGGKLEKTDKWDEREMSYPIKGISRGLYVVVQLALEAGAVAGFERRLRIEPGILRYLLVKAAE